MDRKERGFLIGLVAGSIFCFNFIFLPIWANPILGIIVGVIIGTRQGKKYLQSIKKR